EEYGLEDLEKALLGEVRVTNPNGAAESAIKINHTNVDQVIAGTNGPGSGQKMHYSTDGGTTWSQAAALPLGNTCCDPTVDWSLDGSLAYASALGAPYDILFYRSSDGGQTWGDLSGSRRRLTTDGLNDKPFVHVDKFATSPHVDNIYITYHKKNVMQFARSTDFGDTWSIQAFSPATDQRGVGSDVATDKSGNVYNVWPAWISQRILMRKSTDGGASFGSVIEVTATESGFHYPIPAMESRNVTIVVSADADLSNGPFADSIYAAWVDSTGPQSSTAADNHSRIQVAYSRDGGSTWSLSTPHETADANHVDRFSPWLAVGPDGQVHVIFYDTRRVANRTGVDLFYSSSSDGAVTWTAPSRVTTEISPNISHSFEWGDYNGMDIVLNDIVAIYTDNRNENGGSGDSRDVYAAGIAVTGLSQDAVYNSTYQAPACLAIGSSCDSTTLLDGRGTKGPEINQPNTLDGCPDGIYGNYHSDESNDRIVVKTLDGSRLTEGATVEVKATVYAWGQGDYLDLFYAADATNPSWTRFTTIDVHSGGVKTLSAQYTLPAGNLQAVRANFRNWASPSSCSTGPFDDRDDLVFAVLGAPQDAVYNSTYQAPACLAVGSSCDSTTLLDGRGTMGPEIDQPNTLDGCPDGTGGSYHVDESNDRIVVKTLDGSRLTAGATVQVDATVWAWADGTNDHLDLYYAADADNPSWTWITTIDLFYGGLQTLSAQYTLPDGDLQAVRAGFRYNGSPGSCTTGDYIDHDDLVFTVN
ncbi:MAG: exo-alpha-sialidase, partial [Actinomycetia bacterium]|nr:exo-alpha-sialidase [Actinomycetes bacterium]